MRSRHTVIAEAHPSSLRWLFSGDFKNWLRSEDCIFWISGKPGSGKSTLMKHLINHPLLQAELQKWSYPRRLAIADYFFWVNGSNLERSQSGLLRSILFDILRQCPEMIQLTIPGFEVNSWLESEHDEWTRQELLDALKQVTKQNGLSTKFCIFIDGLDEYEGDHDDLVGTINELAKTSNIKLCIASRPWNVFESAFGSNLARKLYLQDFNKPDIQLYVKSKLEDRPDFQKLNAREPGAKALCHEIVDRSKGVFLWVFLVVRSMVQGIQNADRMSDLRRRLRAFPDDLDEFFNLILMSLDSIYRVQAARGFQMALAASRPMSLLAYWYLDFAEERPYFSSSLEITQLSDEELRILHEEMTKRINARFKGLLEVSAMPLPNGGTSGYQVDFLHRTVKDFLETKAMRATLAQWTTADFDANKAVCESLLGDLKTSQFRKTEEENRSLIAQLVHEFMYSAREYEIRTGQSLSNLLEEMDRTLTALGLMVILSSTTQSIWNWKELNAGSFFSLVISWNLKKYVMEKQAQVKETNLYLERQHYLAYATYKKRETEPDPEMVALVLAIHNPEASFDSDAYVTRLMRHRGEWSEQPVYQTLQILCQRRCWYDAAALEKILPHGAASLVPEINGKLLVWSSTKRTRERKTLFGWIKKLRTSRKSILESP
jgi:hypothetical protein